MARKGEPKAVRRRLDQYATDPWMTRALLHYLPEDLGLVIEPCVGEGAIVRSIGRRARGFQTNDIDVKYVASCHSDATEDWSWLIPEADWVITNPPFNVAIAILIRALQRCAHVALLLRLSFLEPTVIPPNARGEFLAAHPPTKLIVLPRHSFTGDGKTDSVTSAWMVWSSLVEPGIVVVPSKTTY